MKEVVVLKDLTQIKAISQDYRIRILESYNDMPATTKQISDRIGEPHGKVNYHIKALAKVGILELVEESTRIGIVEKFYQPIAKTFMIDSSVMKKTDTKVVKSINQASYALFERISKEFYEASEILVKNRSNKLMHKTDVYLTEEEANELHNKLENVVVNFLKDKDQNTEGREKYFISTLLINCEGTNK